MSDFDDLAHEQQLKRLQALAEHALARYDCIPAGATVDMINLSENATYKITDPASGQHWALRVHREGYHSDAAIASELAWMQALRADGAVLTPVPLPGRDGELIQAVDHELLPRPRNVVLSAWEEGREPEGEGPHLMDWFAVLGETTARMHLHEKAWQRPDGFERHTWDFDTSLGSRPHWGRWRDGMGLTPAIEDVFARTVDLIERRLDRFGKGPDRFGLIHCDMRLANLLVDGDVTKVIDFDDCGFSWLMYDAATTVSFFEDRADVPELMRAWARGYRRVAALSAEDEHEITTFVMLRRLLLVAWIGSHSETELAQSMGVSYTQNTVALCEAYLRDFG